MMKLLLRNFVKFTTVNFDQDLKSVGLGEHADVCSFPRFAVAPALTTLDTVETEVGA